MVLFLFRLLIVSFLLLFLADSLTLLVGCVHFSLVLLHILEIRYNKIMDEKDGQSLERYKKDRLSKTLVKYSTSSHIEGI